jgi:hypothetical protein
MSDQNQKIKTSLRRHRDQTAVKRQVKIAKDLGAPILDAHRFDKRHAMNCGDPQCHMCGNPRKFFKEPTFQEKRLFQDSDQPHDRGSNGLNNDQETRKP